MKNNQDNNKKPDDIHPSTFNHEDLLDFIKEIEKNLGIFSNEKIFEAGSFSGVKRTKLKFKAELLVYKKDDNQVIHGQINTTEVNNSLFTQLQQQNNSLDLEKYRPKGKMAKVLNPYYLLPIYGTDFSIGLFGDLEQSDANTLKHVNPGDINNVNKITNFCITANKTALKAISVKINNREQQEQAKKLEEEKRLQAITVTTQAFEEAKESFKTANDALKVALSVFNDGGQNANDLLEKVKAVQNNFKKLEEQATKLNTLNQEAKISTEFKEQKLYANFLNQNLKQGALDKQSDFMKGLSGKFYKPYDRLSKILEGNNGKITDKGTLDQLKNLKDEGFAFGGQIENNLKTFFKRLEEKIKKGPENTLQQHCKAVSLTLDSDTGTGKTMFMESLLGSKNEKDQYYTNQQDAKGEFKKEGLGDLGALIYGKDREKFVIHCGLVGFEEIKKQINSNKDAIIAFDEWHLLTKEQKIELKPLLDGKNFIKITATPTEVLYKTLKRSEENKVIKQKLLSKKEERKNKVLENVGKASSDIDKLVLKYEYCLSIIDAESKVFKVGEEGISSHKTGVAYTFAEIFGTENLKGIKFTASENQKPEVIICPPKDGKNVIYVLGEDHKYKYQQVGKDGLAKEVKDKKRVFQVFGPSSQEEAKNSRGNIDGGDNGTSSIKNPKILFYSLDNKIVTELEKLLEQGKESLDNKQKAQLVNLINKYDEFIVQAYGRARADTKDIKFKEESAKTLHYQIQDKKANLLEDGIFKATINGTNTLVDYQSFVERFDKNLPKEPEKNKIIVQAFLKVASEENNSEKKEGSLRVEIEPIKDEKGDEKRFNEACNIIRRLSEEQREALMTIGGYDKEGLLKQQKTALETIKATIKKEIKEKRDIDTKIGQDYPDFSSENKIEEKIAIKIASDGKVSLLVNKGVTQFESKEYFQSEGEGKKLTDANANDFKKHIEEHIKGIREKEVKSAQDEYLKTIKEIIEKLQGLDLTPEQKEEQEKAKENLEKTLKLNTKLSQKELEERIGGLYNSAEAQVALQLLEQEKHTFKQQKTESDKKLQQLKDNINSQNTDSEQKKVEITGLITTNQELQGKLNQNQLDINENQKKIEELEKLTQQLEQQKLAEQKLQEKAQLEATKNAELQEQQKLTQKELEENNKALQETQQNLKLKLELEAKNKELQAEELKTKQEQLAANNKELQDKQTQLEQQKLEVQQKQEQLKKQQEQLKKQQEEKDKLEAEKNTALQEAATKNTALQEAAANNKALQTQLEQQKLEVQQKQEQLKKQQEEKDKLDQLEANNKDLQKELDQKNQKIIQLEQKHLEELKEKDKEFQTLEQFQTLKQLTEETEAKIAEIKNKGSNVNIDALFDEKGELKKLYHTADIFYKIGQSNLECDYDKNYYKEASEQDKSDQDKFDLLRKSIIQSSAIRDKHSILQEVLQEKGLMTDALKAYKFKSLDKLIDGDKFKPKFEEGLERLGFGKGENGVWTKVDKEGNKVNYDTSQPYVKDFLINAYYEENFNKFKESLAEDKLTELKESPVERYNAKQKLEFVNQIVNYQAVLMKLNDNELKELESEDIKEKKDDFYKIRNLIQHSDIKTWEDRFKAESKAQEELEGISAIKDLSKKIAVSKSGEFVVNESDLYALKSKDGDEENIVEDHFPNPARSTSNNKAIRVNLGQISSYLELDWGVTASEVNGSNSSYLNKANYSGSSLLQNQNIPSNDTKPIKCENFLMQCIASIKSLIPNSEKVNQDSEKVNQDSEKVNQVLPNANGGKNNQLRS